MHRKNNFDFLRIVLASFVIITHSFILSGKVDCDWLCEITNGQLSFSGLGVKGFFVLSGFLIFQSLERSKSIFGYFWKRTLRLFPALLVILIITVLLGVFVYENNSILYYRNSFVWTYVPNNLSLYNLQFSIPGIFESNPYKLVINGSLWTIPYEFTMYVLLSVLFFVKKRTLIVRFVLLSAFLLLLIANLFFIKELGKYGYILSGKELLDLGLFFIAGSLLSVFRFEKVKISTVNVILAGCLVLAFCSFCFSFFYWVKFFVLPLAIVSFGLKSTFLLNNVGNRVGDLSYGIYIYGFPVQQTLVYYFHLEYLSLMFFSLILSGILAYFSWHLIESRALKLKRIFS